VRRVDDDHARRLFEREARATAQLLHPNIVTLHHVGEHDGAPYLVLELLAGETLAARLARRGKLAFHEAFAVIDAVLAAIAFAHERGVLHRDLKPSNVFVTVDERIKVLDFGVALSLDTDPGPVTRSAGTPGYMAPEQRGGAAQDPRTDVWAAAALLVEMLLGRRPDQRDPAASLGEPDATACLAELDAPPAVRRVLDRALDRDPARRPATAAELRGQLARASGRTASRPRRARQRAKLAGGAVAIAAASAGATYLATRHGPRPAVTPSEINGHAWHVNYGELRMHVDPGGAAYGVYDQKDGILVGRYALGRFVGWWCQLPTRRPPDDAGRVELHFVHGDDRVLIDGEWTYGDGRAAAWQKDFYGVSLVTAPSYRLEQRLQHHELCPDPP